MVNIVTATDVKRLSSSSVFYSQDQISVPAVGTHFVHDPLREYHILS